MSKYTSEQKEIIEKVKMYLKNIRQIKTEKFSLQMEYEDIPAPQSIKFGNEMPGGVKKPLDERYNSRLVRRDLILKRIEIFNEELDRFIPVLYLLKSGQRTIVNCYINSKCYSEMVEMLGEHYINERAYSRNINVICLELAKYIDYDNPPRIEELNRKFNDFIKNKK